MPIQFACPHCGKQTTVADQYAGQAGPCAGCGKPVTIPLVGGAPYPAYSGSPGAGAAAAGAGIGIGIILLMAIGGVVVCAGILVALLLPAVQSAREAARRMQSTNNIRQILIALHNYHDAHNTLPPAVVKDADGKPLYSGMVCLLPYLEQAPLYDRFVKDKPWDAPENLSFSSTNLMVFQDPSNSNTVPGRTDYLLISGPKSILEDAPGNSRRFADVTDGLSNTIILMEVKGNASWAAPNTWDLSKPLDGNHPRIILVGLADGSVHTIQRDISPDTLRRLVERNDGEPIPDF